MNVAGHERNIGRDLRHLRGRPGEPPIDVELDALWVDGSVRRRSSGVIRDHWRTPPTSRAHKQSNPRDALKLMSQIARLFRTHAAAYAGPGSGETEEASVIARIATFEGGDAEEMRRINNQMLVERSAALPPGLLRVMVLMRDDSRWSVVSFFVDEEAARAAEARFEEMGDEIPEHVRGKRVSLDSYEVAFDVEMVR